jgi:hypothetical protein
MTGKLGPDGVDMGLEHQTVQDKDKQRDQGRDLPG